MRTCVKKEGLINLVKIIGQGRCRHRIDQPHPEVNSKRKAFEISILEDVSFWNSVTPTTPQLPVPLTRTIMPCYICCHSNSRTSEMQRMGHMHYCASLIYTPLINMGHNCIYAGMSADPFLEIKIVLILKLGCTRWSL